MFLDPIIRPRPPSRAELLGGVISRTAPATAARFGGAISQADCQLGFLAARRGVLTSAQTAGPKLFRIRHSSERVPSNSMTRIERYIVIALVTAVLGA